MEVYYEKKLMYKYVSSGIFLILLLGIVSFFLIKDKSWATIIVVGPGILYLALRTVILLIDFVNILRENRRVFLSLKNKRLKVCEINGEEIEFQINLIQGMEWDQEAICIRLREPFNQQKCTLLYKLFHYYWINNYSYYTYPLYCKDKELECLCKNSGVIYLQGIKVDEQWVNIFSRYFIIVIGIFNFFIWAAIGNYNLGISIFLVVLLGIIEVIVRITNKAYLAMDRASIGLFVRCTMFSIFVAQYIFCAIRIQEVLKQEVFLDGCSIRVGMLFLIAYIVSIILYLPQQGLGKKMMRFFLKGKSAETT